MVQTISRLLIILSLFVIAIQSNAQVTGGSLLVPPTKYQNINKSLLVPGQRSVDAKFKYYDTLNFVERPFMSVTETNSFIPLTARITGLTVFINTGGTLQPSGIVTGGNNNEYYYRNGITDNDLVIKQVASNGSGTLNSVMLTMPAGFNVSTSTTNGIQTLSVASSLANGFVKSSSGAFISSGIDTTDIPSFATKVRSLFSGSANIAVNANGQIVYTGSAGSGGLSGFTFTNTTGITGMVTNATTAPVLSLSLTADALADGTTNKAFTAAEKTKLAGIAASAQTGTVTSVNISMPTGFSVGSPVTTSGNISVTTTLNGILRGNGSGIVSSTIDTLDISGFASKVRSLYAAGAGLSYNNGTGTYTNTGVLSINGNTGALTMDTGYIAAFYTKVRSLFSVASGGTYNSATGQFVITGGSSGGTIDATPTSGSTNAVSSGGTFNALALKAPLASPSLTGTPTVPLPSVKDSSLTAAPTRYVDRAVYSAVSTAITNGSIKYIQYNNPGKFIQKVSSGPNGDTVWFRGISVGNGLTLVTTGDSVQNISVTSNTYALLAGANVFSNSSYQSFIRSGSNGETARFYGNGSGGHYVSIGTDASFGQSLISSDPGQRLDISAGGSSLNYMFLFASQIFSQSNFGITRTNDATGTSTQFKSKDLTFETSHWNGSLAYNLYHGITTRTSTTTNGLAYLVFKTGNTTNPDLNGTATESLALGTDGSVAFPRMNNGGDDSLLRVRSGVVGKVACPECWTGTPTFTITSGVGASPTYTLSPNGEISNDYSGIVQITAGSSGASGVLVSAITFSTNRPRVPKVILSTENSAGQALGVYAEPSIGGFNIKSNNPAALNGVYKISYEVIP